MKIKAVILAMAIGASASLLHAQTQTPNGTASGTAAPQEPSTNWPQVETPGVRALAQPGAFIHYAPPGGAGCCNGCPGHKTESCLHRLIAWATYCPKERIGCCHSCNSCHYKGVLPIYLFMLNPKCVEGSGIHATFPNPPCTHGCKTCAAGAPCGG